jgi:hypothetical protein
MGSSRRNARFYVPLGSCRVSTANIDSAIPKTIKSARREAHLRKDKFIFRLPGLKCFLIALDTGLLRQTSIVTTSWLLQAPLTHWGPSERNYRGHRRRLSFCFGMHHHSAVTAGFHAPAANVALIFVNNDVAVDGWLWKGISWAGGDASGLGIIGR